MLCVQAKELTVLGETFDEADSIAAVVKSVAAQHGEANVVVLLDQKCASPCCGCLCADYCCVAAWIITVTARS